MVVNERIGIKSTGGKDRHNMYNLKNEEQTFPIGGNWLHFYLTPAASSLPVGKGVRSRNSRSQQGLLTVRNPKSFIAIKRPEKWNALKDRREDSFPSSQQQVYNHGMASSK